MCFCVQSSSSQVTPVDFQVRPTEALSSHHYLCSCTQELWVLLMHLVEHRNKVLHTRVTQLRWLILLTVALCDPSCANEAPSLQSFWTYMSSLLSPLVSGQPGEKAFSGLPTHCKDPLGFTWWLVTHLAMLGQYCRNGTLQSEVRNSCCSLVLIKIHVETFDVLAGFNTVLKYKIFF